MAQAYGDGRFDSVTDSTSVLVFLVTTAALEASVLFIQDVIGPAYNHPTTSKMTKAPVIRCANRLREYTRLAKLRIHPTCRPARKTISHVEEGLSLLYSMHAIEDDAPVKNPMFATIASASEVFGSLKNVCDGRVAVNVSIWKEAFASRILRCCTAKHQADAPCNNDSWWHKSP